MAQVCEWAGVREREVERIEVALEADELDGRVPGRCIERADQRHRVVRGAEADVPHHERPRSREALRDQPRLRDVYALRLGVGLVDRVHDLAGVDVLDAREAVRRGVKAKCTTLGGLPRLRPRLAQRRVVDVVEAEHLALRGVELRERIGLDLGADTRHEAQVEAQIVEREELPAQRLLALHEMVQVRARV